MGQDGEDGQGRDGLSDGEAAGTEPTPFEAELRRNRRFERWLLGKEALVLLVIALLVLARMLLLQ